MEPHRFRSGSPKYDSIGFSATVIGKHVEKVAKEATLKIRQVAKNMSMNEAKEWLKKNYPANAGMMIIYTTTVFQLHENRNTPFPNVDKGVMVGSS